MIFVTVGTHEQQFNRLIAKIDSIAKDGLVDDSIFIQTGYSTYVPEACESKPFLSYAEMQKAMEEADVIVTHGGPSSFMSAISLGKHPVVVPRLQAFGEHVNDHQVEFVTRVSETLGGFTPVYDVDRLLEAIEKARGRVEYQLPHNAEFCEQLRPLIDDLFL